MRSRVCTERNMMGTVGKDSAIRCGSGIKCNGVCVKNEYGGDIRWCLKELLGAFRAVA